MSKKIAVITTGGTIGGVLSSISLDVDPTGSVLSQEISRICKQYSLDVVVRPALNKLSEDMTPGDWALIVNAVKSCLSEGINRIVITHGTATFAYAAAVCGIVFGNTDARICITGAYYSFDAPESDGPLNLIAAIRSVVLDELPTGVYTSFRADDRNVQASILPALAVRPMNYDGVAFKAMYSAKAALYEPRGGLALFHHRPFKSIPELPYGELTPENMLEASRKVLQVTSFPGLRFDQFKTDNLEAIVVAAYHTGEGYSEETEGSLMEMLHKQKNGPTVFLTCLPSRLVVKPYESTVKIAGAGGVAIADLQPHVIYAFLVLGLAGGISMGQMRQALGTWTLAFAKR